MAASERQPDLYSRESLRTAPTAAKWEIEIEKILDGERDHVLDHLGDAGAYIEEAIREALDPQVSRHYFYEALDVAVAHWRPGRGDAWMIDLLRRFTPRSGHRKLIELFRDDHFPGDPDPEAESFLGTPLRLRALQALERYFPASPLSGKAEDYSGLGRLDYATYTSILRAHLRFKAYREYVLQLFSRLDEPKFLDPQPLEATGFELALV